MCDDDLPTSNVGCTVEVVGLEFKIFNERRILSNVLLIHSHTSNDVLVHFINLACQESKIAKAEKVI